VDEYDCRAPALDVVVEVGSRNREPTLSVHARIVVEPALFAGVARACRAQLPTFMSNPQREAAGVGSTAVAQIWLFRQSQSAWSDGMLLMMGSAPVCLRGYSSRSRLRPFRAGRSSSPQSREAYGSASFK
jgi:hypothetical protein